MNIAHVMDTFSECESVGVYMGSFDPFHKGHQWIAETLLKRCDGLLLLIPGRHYEKTVVWPRNAAFSQRVAMIRNVFDDDRPVAAAVTDEVLFIRLDAWLSRRLPGKKIRFGMGSDTFQKMLDSKRFYAKFGQPWTAADARGLARLARPTLVFGRSATGPECIRMPRRFRGISSTKVRNRVKRLQRMQAPFWMWRLFLSRILPGAVIAAIRKLGLYSPDSTLVPPHPIPLQD